MEYEINLLIMVPSCVKNEANSGLKLILFYNLYVNKFYFIIYNNNIKIK